MLLTDRRTDRPKPIHPLNFFEVGGIIKKKIWGGGGGARVSELFLQRIRNYKKNIFFLRRVGGGGGGVEEGTRVSDFFFYKEFDFRHSLTSDLIVPLTLGIGTYLLCAT